MMWWFITIGSVICAVLLVALIGYAYEPPKNPGPKR